VLTYKILTPRLIIRCYDPESGDALLLKTSIDQSLEHLKPWMPWAWNEPEPLEAKAERVKKFRKNFDSGTDYTLGVFNLTETELIGSCGLHTRLEYNAREIGYWLNVNHINKGYATEIVEALLQVGFGIEKLDRIEIRCDSNNKISARIPEKCGFTFKEILTGNIKDVFGSDRDTMIWEMTSKNYASKTENKFPVKAFDKEGKEIL
jgi:RimJ/RimL family protein N-acetyltransferase